MFKVNNDQVPIEILAEFAYNENQGANIIENCKQKFGDVVNIIEHFKSFFRIGIEEDLGLGEVFNHFESIKT